MTVIKTTTLKGAKMVNSAMINEGYYLTEVYNNPSKAKINAWEQCVKCCHDENGKNFHICSHNTFNFSVAWETKEGVRLETACNSYLIKY